MSIIQPQLTTSRGSWLGSSPRRFFNRSSTPRSLAESFRRSSRSVLSALFLIEAMSRAAAGAALVAMVRAFQQYKDQRAAGHPAHRRGGGRPRQFGDGPSGVGSSRCASSASSWCASTTSPRAADKLLIPYDGHPRRFTNELIANELKRRLVESPPPTRLRQLRSPPSPADRDRLQEPVAPRRPSRGSSRSPRRRASLHSDPPADRRRQRPRRHPPPAAVAAAARPALVIDLAATRRPAGDPVIASRLAQPRSCRPEAAPAPQLPSSAPPAPSLVARPARLRRPAATPSSADDSLRVPCVLGPLRAGLLVAPSHRLPAATCRASTTLSRWSARRPAVRPTPPPPLPSTTRSVTAPLQQASRACLAHTPRCSSTHNTSAPSHLAQPQQYCWPQISRLPEIRTRANVTTHPDEPLPPASPLDQTHAHVPATPLPHHPRQPTPSPRAHASPAPLSAATLQYRLRLLDSAQLPDLATASAAPAARGLENQPDHRSSRDLHLSFSVPCHRARAALRPRLATQPLSSLRLHLGMTTPASASWYSVVDHSAPSALPPPTPWPSSCRPV